MLTVIWICCLDAVDATVYAAKQGIKLREQGAAARIIDTLGRVPASCRGLDIRATPEFWTALTHPATSVGRGSVVEVRARANVAARVARDVTVARTIETAIRLRGGTIQPPYDVPESLDREAVEEWLDRD